MRKNNLSKLEEEMHYHIQSWRQGKQSQQEYCRENNLAYHKFIYWQSKFRRKQNPIEQAFIPIQLEQPVHSSSMELEIAYPNGVRLRVPSGNIQFIGQLIRLI
jgi:hypothetical protein